MKVDPVTLSLLESLSINPKVGVKVTAAKIGISRVTLWSIRETGMASKTTMKRIGISLHILVSLNNLNPKSF